MKKFLSITHKSFNDLKAANYQELWAKAQSDGYTGISVHVDTEYTKSADAENKFHAIFSSANEDRHGDVVKQEFDTKSFKKNPVFLDSHDYYSIEAIIGKVVKIGLKDGMLSGDIEFAMENPRGALAARLAEGGFLGATSIGFIPKEFDDKGNILKSELLEVSAVSVPANADAIFERSIKSEDTEEEPEEEPIESEEPDVVVDAEPEEEPEPASAPKSINKKKVAAKVVSEMVSVNRSHLKALSKAVHELTEDNKQTQRRKIHQAVRNVLKNG